VLAYLFHMSVIAGPAFVIKSSRAKAVSACPSNAHWRNFQSAMLRKACRR
jgi:hypothetical protein